MNSVGNAATWLPAVRGEAVQSLEVRPEGAGTRVVLYLTGPGEVLGLDPVAEVLAPRVAELWKAVPPTAAKACQAAADAQAGLKTMEAEERQAQVAADAKIDSGLTADAEVARADELAGQIRARREVVRRLRQRAEEAVRQSLRDLRVVVGVARSELLQELAVEAEAVWDKLALDAGPHLLELARLRATWLALVGDTNAAVSRLEGQFVPEMPEAVPEPRGIVVPVELQPRYGHLDPALNMFREGDPPRAQPQPAVPADPGLVAKIAAELSYTSRVGYLDEKDRFHEGEPPRQGEPSRPAVPSYTNTTIEEAAREVQKRADQEAKEMAEQWRQEFDAKRLAEQMLDEAKLPEATPLPEPQPLPEPTPLPAAPTVLEPPAVPVNDEDVPRKRSRRS
jgi:hypothetical protein